MKGNFKKGLKIYKMSSKTLDLQAENSYINIENKKIPLKCKLEIHLNKPVKMTVTTAVYGAEMRRRTDTVSQRKRFWHAVIWVMSLGSGHLCSRAAKTRILRMIVLSR